MIDDERLGVPSASGIERITLCPGSWNAEKGQPDRSNADADKGTRIHAMLEAGEIPDGADKSEAEDAERCAAMERRIMEEFGLPPDAAPWMNEQRLFYRKGLRPIFSGKPDKVYMDGERALIIDYKTGRGEYVEAAKNLQLRALAVLVKRYADNEGIPLTSIGVAIVQPYGKGERQIATYSITDLEHAEREILRYIAMAQQPDAPRRPGIKQCQYCKAKETCEELKATVKESLTIQTAPLSWEMLSPEDKLKIYDLASNAERWAASTKTRIREDLEAGISIPGLGLKEGSCPRKINPVSAQILAQEVGVPNDEFAAACDIGITKYEAAIKKATGLTMKEVKALIDAKCEVTKKQNKASVVRVP